MNDIKKESGEENRWKGWGWIRRRRELDMDSENNKNRNINKEKIAKFLFLYLGQFSSNWPIKYNRLSPSRFFFLYAWTQHCIILSIIHFYDHMWGSVDVVIRHGGSIVTTDCVSGLDIAYISRAVSNMMVVVLLFLVIMLDATFF